MRREAGDTEIDPEVIEPVGKQLKIRELPIHFSGPDVARERATYASAQTVE
jgi:hypothetical protein